MPDLIEAFVTIFAILDAIGNVPVFLSLTSGLSAQERRNVARKSSVYSGALLLFFSTVGKNLFSFFGVTLPGFRVAGGLVLLKVAFDMLQFVDPPRLKSTNEETIAAREKNDISLVPLAVPMLAGPGAISAVLVLSEQAQGLSELGVIWAVIAANAFFVYVIFRVAEPISHLFGTTGMGLVSRIIGLILASIAIQFVLSGIREFLSIGV